MYEKIHAPKIYELDHGIKIDHKQEPMPDSFYAVTKLFGENLGRFLVEERGISYTSLRIGSVREKDYDHPYAYAEYGFQQNLWSRDFMKRTLWIAAHELQNSSVIRSPKGRIIF